MQDIHEVLRRKQAQHAELGRQIEALQSAAETLRAVAPLLEDSHDNDAKLGNFGEASAPPMAKSAAAGASASSAPSPSPKPVAARTTVPRWP